MADISQLSDEQLISLLQQTEPERPPASGFESRFTDVTGYLNPKQLGDTPKEILDTAVAEGLISPTYTPADDATDEFSTAWRTYQQEMAPSAAGAAFRGATRAIIPTLGGIAGGAAGSVVPVPGAAIVGGMAGAMAGSALQEKMMPMSTEEQAQAQFDVASRGTRYSRMAGEVIPQFLVARPAVSTIGKALAGDVAAAKSLAVGAGFGAGTSLAGSAAQGELPDLERLAFDTITGAALEPSRLGQKLFDRTARQEIAAQQAATNVMGKFVKNKPQAIADLAAAGELAGEGVRPLSGDVVGDEGFLGLQQALRNREAELRNIDQASAEALAKGVDVTLEPTALSPLRTQEIFAAQNEGMLARAQEAYDGLMRQGDTASANIMRQAQGLADEQMTLVNDGVKAAEHGNATIALLLQRAESEIAQRRGDQTESGKVVSNALKAEEGEAYQGAKELWTKLNKLGVVTDFANARNAVKQIKKEVSLNDPPAEVLSLLEKYKNPKKKVPVDKLITAIQEVGSAQAQQLGPGGNKNTARLLGKFKDALDADLDALGNISSEVKEAKAAWKVYADKYLNKASGQVLARKSNVEPSQTIEAYATSVEGLQQLRSAASNRKDVVTAVGDWIYGQMLDSVRGNPSLEAIQGWVNGKTGRMLLDVFPEVYQSKIAPELAALASAEKQLEFSEVAIAKAKEIAAEKGAVTTKQLQQATVKAETAKARIQEPAQIKLQDAKKAVQSSQAAAYIGAAPEAAIGKVINSENAAVYMTELVARAAQDESGQAIEGLKNALKNYLNVAVRRPGEVASTKNTLKPLVTADLSLSPALLNEYFREGGSQRAAIEILLGKDSKELQALDKARKQVEMYARRRRAAGGQSVTSLNQMLAGDLDVSLAETTLGVLGRLTSSVMPMELKRVTGVMSDLTDVFRTIWRGDVAKKAQGMLVNAMIDPQAAIELLRPLDRQSLPRIKSWLRVYPQSGASLPFNEINTNEQQLPSGTVTTDNFTGYRIVQTGKNSFKLYNDRKQLEGIFTSGNDARRAAVRKAFGSK
ncbi:hypothetical protein UFOVP811_25 [uncultured Caudovirales phage]|uniref:Uncharacterized protein n=1 Tax=uncultured Caudovirales phage TaxID=2100421 RepID=A0A6J5P2I0_9CAUD|nr:hypothetical protein UFOVP811_25 [uncultured Caudovirales phage]